MLQTEPDLSPDLEWMLKSSQASDDLILSPLLDEYLEPLYQDYFAQLGDLDEARQALAETFADVLIERHRFSDRMDVKAFVYRQAARVYRRRKRLSWDYRSARLPFPEGSANSRHLQGPLPSLPPDCYDHVFHDARLTLDRKKRSRHAFYRTMQFILGALIFALMIAIGAVTNRIAALESPLPLAARTVLHTQIVRVTVIVTSTPAHGTPAPGTLPQTASLDFEPGDDPASSQLAFRWQQSQPAQVEGFQEVTVDVLADGDFLGQMQISDPWSTSCERSPDGRFLAFVERPDLPPFPFSRVRLAVIPELHSLVEPLPRGSRYGNDVAFSPDSRRLAFWGCSENRECGVYLLNLFDQELEMLLPGRYTAYFTWSPDGEEIAMLRANGDFVVVNAGTGKVTYEHVTDWLEMEIPLDAPINSWGLAFPPVQSDLRGCEAPGEG